MSAFAERQNVLAIAGNHDYFWGVDKKWAIILQNKGIWPAILMKDLLKGELKLIKNVH